MNGFMKELKTTDLQPGMIVGVAVKTATGQVIVNPGTLLTRPLITRIGFYKVDAVTIYFKNPVSEPAPPATAPAKAEAKPPIQPQHRAQADASAKEAPVFKNTEQKKATTFIKQTENIIAPSHTGGTANPTYSQQVKRSSTFLSFETSFAISISEIMHYFGKVCDGTIAINTKTIIDAINNLASICHTSIDLFDMLHNMRQNNDSIYAHCLDVSLISRQMGIWLKLPKEDMDMLIVAGLFHDIGKLKLPPDLLNKKGRLTDEEFSLIHHHPQYGYDILKKQNVPQKVKKTALQHHERCDGSGYPLGLMAEELDDFSMIIAIADVYDAMTASRAYRSPLCPFQVIAEFEKEGLQKYNPKFILTFLEQIAKTYQNNRVLLNNGVSGNIVLLNQKHLAKPIIQINDGSCIDLSTSELYIKSLI